MSAGVDTTTREDSGRPAFRFLVTVLPCVFLRTFWTCLLHVPSHALYIRARDGAKSCSPCRAIALKVLNTLALIYQLTYGYESKFLMLVPPLSISAAVVGCSHDS